jgi:hypothetical protein
VSVSALPKARVNVDEFLAWSQRQPDGDTRLMDDCRCRISLPEQRAIVPRERNAAGNTEAPIVQDGKTALDPSGISASVAALLGC